MIHPTRPRRALHTGVLLTVPSLLVAGLVTFAPVSAPVADAAEAPPGSDIYHVSHAPGGTTSQAYLAPGAQQVAFVSTDESLVAGDHNGVADVFVSTALPGSDDPFGGEPQLISVPDGPVGATRANAASDSPVMSADGRWVAFSSTATNLVSPASPAGMSSIYVRDTVNDTTIRLTAPGVMPNGKSYSPDISDDGRYVVFTSDASNLSPGDTNDAPDAYLADLDTDGNGIRGDVSLTRFLQTASVIGGTYQAVISGNGRWVSFVSATDRPFRDDGNPGDTIFRAEVASLTSDALLIATGASEPSIDANGSTLAYVRADVCGPGQGSVAVASISSQSAVYTMSLGTVDSDHRSGKDWAPRISSDASTVAWTTTVPPFDFNPPIPGTPAPALDEPVIRVQKPNYWDTRRAHIECGSGIVTPDWYDIAPGEDVTMSASGRSFAWTASDFTYVLDSNSNNGLSVTTTLGEATTPEMVASVPISTIPLASLHGYAGELANAPIHQLPIHQLPIHQLPIYQLPIHQLLIDDAPIHQLPIHQLPIHQLPIHQLDLPGGWDQLLAGTELGGQLIQTLTLDEVLDWAAKTVAGCPADGDPTASIDCIAARRVQKLTLGDLGLDGSGLDALSLASYVLGNAPLGEIPIPGDGDPLARWQSLADGQGLQVQVPPDMVLAQLDAAGLDVAHAGLEDVGLTQLPLDKTLFGYLSMRDLFFDDTPLGDLAVATLTAGARADLFGATPVTGTLADNDGKFLGTATVAQLVAGLTTNVTFGTLLFSLLDRQSFPWEEIDPASLDLTKGDHSPTSQCPDNNRCAPFVDFRATFDAGPGKTSQFPAPTVSVNLPGGTQLAQLFASGAGPDQVWSDLHEYAGPVQQDGGLVRVPLPDITSGTTLALDAWFSATARPGDSVASAEVVSGALHASDSIGKQAALGELDDPRDNIETQGIDNLRVLDENSIFYEWLSPAWFSFDEESSTQTEAKVSNDADYYTVLAPPPGKRLVISSNAKDGQIALALYSRSGVAGAALGNTNASVAPGTAVNEQSGIDGQPAESGADAGAALPGQILVDQAVAGSGGGAVEVEAASADTQPGEELTIRVTSGNGAPSSTLYSLRARYIDEPVETACPAFAPVMAASEGVVGTSDAVNAQTDTIYLFDQQRYGLRYGAAAAVAVRASLAKLSDPAEAGAGAVHGAVLAIDSSPGVQAARVKADQNPCSMTSRRALTSAINTFVASAIGTQRGHITSVVIVGGDDMIPLAPVGQHTADFTEQSHAGDLRLAKTAAGDPCPPAPDPNAVDPCATPLSAAASGAFVLTDDPYGLPDTYESLGGYLYVPTVALGRLVETPEQIESTITRYLDADGVLDVSSSVTGGYGAWSELPGLVTQKLDWRIPPEKQNSLTGTWDAAALSSAVFGAAQSPRVVSINTHADETRLLPGILGAESGRFVDSDLFKAATPTEDQLATLQGALIFMIGCHAGNNLPSAYYGNITDWVDVFSRAGGYVGNTGYGLANNVTTALSERLLSLYADWIGSKVDTQNGAIPVSASGALTYAKQSYLGGVGLYSGYDEKALMESVYYGLPMYSIAGPLKDAPLPEPPSNLAKVTDPDADGLATASLSFAPHFADPTSVTLPDGRTVQYLTAAPDASSPQQDPVAVAGQPVLPRLVSKLAPAPDGLKARGVLITALSSEYTDAIDTPAIGEPNVGVNETESVRAGGAFPSSFAAVSRQDTPAGPIDLLVVTPARVVMGQSGAGKVEKFTDMGLDVVYGSTRPIDANTPVENVPPIVRSVEVPARGGSSSMVIDADGTGSPVKRMVLLIQPQGSTSWTPVEVAPAGDGKWAATIPTDLPYRWLLQVADAYGNVTTESERGRLGEAGAPAPTLGELGAAVHIQPGERVARTVPVGSLELGDRLTGQVVITGADGVATTGDAVVKTAVDGTTTVQFDEVFPDVGDYTLTLRLCRGLECSESALPVTVATTNELPSATVRILGDGPVLPSATLTAEAAGTDADAQDEVTLTYAWYRNGAATGVNTPTLSLPAIGAQPGDVIEVAATPSDGKATGHIGYARVTVDAEPPAPTIELSATNSLGAYPGAPTWSTSTVTVAFTCTGVGITCPAPRVVSADTGTVPAQVEGHVTDFENRTASVGIGVLVDKTVPRLAPTATPTSTTVGGTITVAANATDDGSGIDPARTSCAAPDTSTAGAKTVTCTATDRAGNSATASVAYTVTPPPTRSCAGGSDRTARAPLNADGSSVFLRTSGVPVIFSACDAKGNPIGTKGLVKKVTLVSSTALSTQAWINELWYPSPTSFTYQKQLGVWTGAIPTLKLDAGRKYVYRIDLSDGTSFTVTFGVRW